MFTIGTTETHARADRRKLREADQMLNERALMWRPAGEHDHLSPVANLRRDEDDAEPEVEVRVRPAAKGSLT